ncbi:MULTISPECIES: competence protein ComK [unclassified Bacillus (in: firmicutes)]|nr:MULTISPECIES: competence protein ComK [unclassified Bacillus (in: firmicutes)]
MCYKKFGGRKDGTKEYTDFTYKAPIAISPIRKKIDDME